VKRVPGGCPVVDATNNWGQPLYPERATAERTIRVVLAEAAVGPGPLHYLLEAEGFQILGSAADDDDLARILAQSSLPEVIVIDAAVPASAATIAHEFAPDAELIVIWPESVVPPAWADQVLPELVYQDLGTAVYRAADRNRLRRPVVQEPVVLSDDPGPDLDVVGSSAVAARRSAARVLVGTVALIAAIVLTMGVSFALEGWRASHLATPPRPQLSPQTTTGAGRASPAGSVEGAHGAKPATKTDCATTTRPGPDAHAPERARQHATGCPSGAAGANGTGRGQGAASGAGVGSGAQDHGGQGSAHGSGHGQGSGNGAAGTDAPSDHPTGPPSTAPGSAHAAPKD
jgi:hypothetical protein